MNSLVLVMISALVAVVVAQSGTTTNDCWTGMNTNYTSTAKENNYAPILKVAGTTYNTGGYYASKSAEECCYNCLYQTSDACTTWTFNSCGSNGYGTCYLSSATGTSYKLESKAPVSGCTFTSGFTKYTTTTVATTTTAASSSKCFTYTGYNSPNSGDAYFTTAATADECCTKCKATSTCKGFAFTTGVVNGQTVNGCWLKTYDPLATNSPIALVPYSGMVLGTA